MKTPLLAGTGQAAALVWTVALVVDSTPFEVVPAFLVGLGLLAVSTVATVGMVVVGGRWAHRLGLGAIGITAIIAIVRPIDVIWVVGIVTSAAALAVLLSPAVTKTIRRLPSASGPPPRAIAPALILLVVPSALGLTGNEATPSALLAVGSSALLVAFMYARVVPGGLIAARVLWPALALGLAPLLGLWCGIASAVLAAAVALVSWDRSVSASYHPPREVGTTFPIPTELAPREILDAAEIDDTGRPL